MLTRELISSGEYLRLLETSSDQRCWSEARIEQSMKDTLANRPRGEPLWLFAYGSLMWNPLIRFEEQQTAVLPDWHRSFCIRLCAGRATPEVPGRMLALRKGGVCDGIAFRLSDVALEAELRLVWIREMPHGLYRPVWTQMNLSSGEQVMALTFVADVNHPQYDDSSDQQSIANTIARASGRLGSNQDYLRKVHAELQRLGLRDPGIQALWDASMDVSTLDRTAQDCNEILPTTEKSIR